MTPTPTTSISATLYAAADLHTPGPWEWCGNAKNNDLYLATTHSGRRYVMGFDRWGMRDGQPRFRDGSILRQASELLQFEVGDQSVVGIEAAKADESVYRYDIRGIASADARLIASAPILKAENAVLRELVQCLLDNDPSEPIADGGIVVLDQWRKDARAALAKAAS